MVRAAIQPGVTKTWMNLLKIKVDTFNDYQRPCVLYVDEVPLKPKIFYNITYDKVIGVVIDSATGDVAPARYVTVVMAQGVCAPWRQPIAYHFNGSRCNGVRLKRIVTDSLHKLTDMNLKVMALMCGTDANYVQMAQMLGVSADKPQFWAAGRQAHFLFDVQRLSQDLWNAFLTVKIRLNDCVISQYVKAQAEQYPHLFPTKNSKACKVGRNYRKRIFTDKLPGGIYTYGDKIHSRDSICTNKFLTIVDNFSTLMLDKTDMFHGYADERDPIDACFDLFNKIQPVDKDIDASVCIRRWKATVRSIANLWEEIRGLGFARMYIPSMRCFSEFSQHLPGKEKQDFYDLRLTPIQFTRAFINCFTKELLKTERTCSDEKMSENDTIFYAKLLEAANLPQTNKDDNLFTDDIDYRSVEFHFPSDLLCEYLLNKCLRQHSCPLCVNYIAIHRTYMLQNPEPRGDRFIETLEILHKPHKTFFGFVAGMDSTFKLSFKSAIVHNCTVKYLTGLLRKLSLVHPCLKFPFKYVTKLYARLRLYHTLKYVDDKIKRSDESFQINDGLLMEARDTF
ncbi:unnamed protein product [Acanthoscelides obtectus]|nr:unnamed protein product [Acanthoscelides obtectus]CAK1659450.1 DNA transposase THAP9 [Acanthoscelides obtectus]